MSDGHMTVALHTDAMSPEIPRGDRVLFHPDVEPEDGDLVIVQTPAGKLIRRVYFSPEAVTLAAPNAEPAAYRRAAVQFEGVACASFRGESLEIVNLYGCAKDRPRRPKPPGVTDLAVWVQAHPRPIRNTIFAERQ